jgi:hypothetical protein
LLKEFIVTDSKMISAAVQSCLSEALRSDKPFRAINEYLATLKRLRWTDEERIQVQQQVLEEMKRRRRNIP